MYIRRRHVVAGLAATGLAVPAFAVTGKARAQDAYPSRPITLLVAYAAGGGTDTVARAFAAKLEKTLGGSIIVENRPGAGGGLATDAAANAKPDGYTLLIGNQGPMVVNPHLFKSLKSDPEKTLDPICLIADAALVIVVNPKLGITTLPALIDLTKRKAGDLVYASASNGSASHLAAVLLGQVSGTKARHVPYRGAGPALNDLLGGHVDFMVTTIPSVRGQIDGGSLTALAVTGPQRSALLPAVPTAIEAGLAGYAASTWYGLLAPKGLPPDLHKRLEDAALATLKQPDVIAKLREDGADPGDMRHQAFRAFMADERRKWGEIVKAAEIKIGD